jgi:hypothetical protein
LRNEPTTALHTNSNTTILVVDIRDFTPMARSLPEHRQLEGRCGLAQQRRHHGAFIRRVPYAHEQHARQGHENHHWQNEPVQEASAAPATAV